MDTTKNEEFDKQLYSDIRRLPMFSKKQVKSLEKLAQDIVVADIFSLCSRVNDETDASQISEQFVYARTVIREFCNSQIPLVIRKRLHKACLFEFTKSSNYRSCFADSNVFKYVLDIVLNIGTTDHVTLMMCFQKEECRYKADMLRIVADACAKGEDTLKIIAKFEHLVARSTFIDLTFFNTLLFSCENVTKLVINFFADDNLLALIGKYCKHVTVLDFSNSDLVTDKGIMKLIKGPMNNSPALTDDLTMPPWRQNMLYNSSFLNLPPDVSTHRRYLLTFCLRVHSNELCGTLTNLIINHTNVTNFGILIALMNVRGLQEIDNKCYSSKALELLNQMQPNSVQLELTQVKGFRLSYDKLLSISNMCAKLEELSLLEPVANQTGVVDLSCLPATLTALNLAEASGEFIPLVRGVQQYLFSPRSRALQKLTLVVEGAQHLEFDVCVLMDGLTGLKSLLVRGMLTTWDSCEPSHRRLALLETLELSHINGPQVLERLIEHAPLLNNLRFDKCDELLLPKMTVMFRKFPRNMSCVFWNDLPSRTHRREITVFLDELPTLGLFGNKCFWGLSNVDNFAYKKQITGSGRISAVSFIGPDYFMSNSYMVPNLML